MPVCNPLDSKAQGDFSCILDEMNINRNYAASNPKKNLKLDHCAISRPSHQQRLKISGSFEEKKKNFFVKSEEDLRQASQGRVLGLAGNFETVSLFLSPTKRPFQTFVKYFVRLFLNFLNFF